MPSAEYSLAIQALEFTGISVELVPMNEFTRPHRDRAALLTIDVQNDFTVPGAPAEIEGTVVAVPKM